MKNYCIVGASHGIGEQIGKLLAEENKIINISRTEPQWSHSNLTHYEVDVTKDDLPDLDEIDGLVYCPGTINLKPIKSLKLEDFRHDFEINVLGAVKTVQKYIRNLKKGENPAMVFFSTVAVKQGMPFHSSVAVSKAGVEGLTRTLAAELAPTIRVNCIAPTLTDTPLASGILKNDDARERMADRHPLKRIVQAEEIANMAHYLLSNQSKSITGQVIGIDAGIGALKL